MRHVVISAACVVMDEEQKRHHLYFGAPVPEYVQGAQLQRLLDEEFVTPVDVPVVLTPADGDPVEIVPAAGVFPVFPVDPPGVVADTPAVSDLKPAWVDHAVAQGMPRDEAEAATKQELVDRYGG